MAAPAMMAGSPAHHRPWYKHLYAQVLVAIGFCQHSRQQASLC